MGNTRITLDKNALLDIISKYYESKVENRIISFRVHDLDFNEIDEPIIYVDIEGDV